MLNRRAELGETQHFVDSVFRALPIGHLFRFLSVLIKGEGALDRFRKVSDESVERALHLGKLVLMEIAEEGRA